MSVDIPAFGRLGGNLRKGAHTVGLGAYGDDILHQPGTGDHHFKGGARRRRILGCIIILRIGLVLIQLCIILRIYGIRHFVIVISRIGDQGQHIPRVYIRDYTGGIAGIQCQLSRSDIQIVDTMLHEIIGAHASAEDAAEVLFRHLHQPLFAENLTHLPAAYHIIQKHVLVKTFLKLCIFVYHSDDILYYLIVYLRGIGVFIVKLQLADIYPVPGNAVFQIFVQADHLIRLPGDLRGVIGLYRLCHDHTVIPQEIYDIALINLIFLAELIVRGQLLGQLRNQPVVHLLLIHQMSFVHFPLRIARILVGQMSQVNDGIVEHGKVHIVDGNLNICAVRIFFGNILLRIDDFAGHKARQPLLQDIVHGLGQVPVYGKIHVLSGLRFPALLNGYHLAHIVHNDLLIALIALERGLKVGLYPSLSYHVIDIVDIAAQPRLLHLRVQLGQFLGRNLAHIPEHMGKILAVHIPAHGSLLDADSRQGFRILHNHSHRLIAYIGGNSGADILPVGSKIHGIAYRHHFQPVFFGVTGSWNEITSGILRILIFPDAEHGSTA